MATPSFAKPALILARAFHDDPLHVRVDPPPERRRRALPPLFRCVLRHAHRYGTVMDDNSAVLAWLPLANAHMSLIDQARCGMWALPASWSWGPLFVMAKHEEQAVGLVRANAPHDAAYLYIVGVEPEVAGRGLGKALIVRALRDMAPHFRTCMLKTDQPRNVPMYQHLGFHVVAHEIIPSSGSPVWIMRQELPTAT